MNNDSQSSVKDKNISVTHLLEQVNLNDFGYEKSGNVKGDPQIFKTYLNRIGNGDLVDENYSGISDEEKSTRRGEIKELEKELVDAKKLNAKTEKEIEVLIQLKRG